MKIKEYQDAQEGHSSAFHGICFAFLQAPQPEKWRKLPQKNGKTSMPSSGQITETKSLFQHQKVILKMPKMVNKESDLKSSSLSNPFQCNQTECSSFADSTTLAQKMIAYLKHPLFVFDFRGICNSPIILPSL
jgi:hypothetical protein